MCHILHAFGICERMYAQTLEKAKIDLEKKFYAMAKAYRKNNFEFYLNQVGNIDHRIKSYLENDDFKKWARMYTSVN